MPAIDQPLAERFAQAVYELTYDIREECEFRGIGADEIKVHCHLPDGDENELVVKVRFKGIFIRETMRV